MEIRYGNITLFLTLILIISSSISVCAFPAPISEPAAAIYLYLSRSGIFDEDNQNACEEIANTTVNICKYRNGKNSFNEKEYKSLCLNFLKNSIISGFLKIQELFFYYKYSDEYALIAKGEFNLQTIANMAKAEKYFNDDNNLIKIVTTIDAENDGNEKIVLEVSNDTLVICPQKSYSYIINNLSNNQNLLGEKFKIFEKMVQYKPAISAEINLKKILLEQNNKNIPSSLTATKLVRLFIAPNQNRLQISIPKEEERNKLKKELEKQTVILNSFFDNKTDYHLKEGKTSIFIETKTDNEQVQSISRKAMAFLLHFFIKNIPSDQS